MPATRTEAQRAASRLNGAKSNGPTSDAGKARSRENALKHGLSDCEGVVIPDDLHARAESEVAAFFEQFNPRTDYEASLVRQAAMASARLTKLGEVELAASQENVRRAADDWDARQEEQVAELAELFATDPGRARRGLWRSTAGCEFMADAWVDLSGVLEKCGTLDAACRARLANLVGHRELATHGHDAHLRVLAEFCDAIDAHDPAARAGLLEFLRSQEDECRDRADRLWRGVDGPSRGEASRRAMLDTSPDGRRLMRYLAAAERSVHRALAALEAARAEQEPAPTGPHDARLDHWTSRIKGLEDTATAPPAPAKPKEPGTAQHQVRELERTLDAGQQRLQAELDAIEELMNARHTPKQTAPHASPPPKS